MSQNNIQNIALSFNASSRKSALGVIFWLCGLFFALSASGTAAEPPKLQEGDSVFPTKLVNESGEPVQLNHPERPTIMTFIFTRCAAMEFCPRMNSRFNELQERALSGDLDDVRLLSITLDPEHDQPERLKEFGQVIGADPEVWNFATGSKAEIDRLTKAFRVFSETSKGTINHTLCTALVMPDGTIQKIWRGNFWKVEDVEEALNTPSNP